MEMQLDYSVRLTQMPGTDFELWTKKARLGYSGPGFNLFRISYSTPLMYVNLAVSMRLQR